MVKKRVLITGNEAMGEATILAGCHFYAGYPITPQNELTAYMAKRMIEVGGTFIQSESELAAINMVLGASAAGARAMTSSSSPGISLKQEGISYLAACQLPAVIVNVMRGGPGLGNIAPAQSDYFQATKGGGHGDYHQIVLAPASVQESIDLTILAFDLADKYRNPVMVLTDGILGQMMEPILVDSRLWLVNSKDQKPKTKNQKLTTKKWALTGCKGRKPNVIRSLLLGKGELEKLNRELQEKYERIKTNEVRCESLYLSGSEIILVAYGTSSRICKAAMEKARADGLKVGLIRPITLWPFPSRIISQAALWAKVFLVVEMSSGQMVEDVRLAVEGKAQVKFYGRSGGGVPTEEAVGEELHRVHRVMAQKLKNSEL